MVRRTAFLSRPLLLVALAACSEEQITAPGTKTPLQQPMFVVSASAADGKIAFVRTDLTQNDIWVMNPDGTGQTNISNTSGAQESSASWSPDGTKIVFVSDRDDINGEIYVMNADGTGVTRLTTNTALDGFPAWSPIGNKIAFVSQRVSASQEIYVMNADGTNQIRLTTHDGDDRKPTWSADGSRIAFYNLDDYDIYTMNADGTALTNITNTPSFQDSDPAWSPLGDKIAFTHHTGSNNEIFVMNTNGSGQTSLTAGSPPSSAPAWSPDGTRIAFERFVSGTNPSELYVMNADGTAQTNIGNTPANQYSYWPSWWGARDRDNDGIDDVIDTAPTTPSVAFSDIPLGGRTAGTIESIPANVSVAIHEAIPGGVRVTTTATGTVAANARVVIRLAGKSQLEKLVIPGTYLITDPETSVTIGVESGGPAEVELSLNGSPILVTISEGASATVDETTDANGVLTAVTVSDVTGDSGDVTVNGETVEPGSPPVAVSTLAAKLAVRRGQLTLTGTFTPAAASVNPGTNDITLQVGEYTFVKTGGLSKNKSGAYTFDGTMASEPGVHISLELKQAKGGGAWALKATASPVSGFVNPVTVSLRIGDVSASTQVTATLR